MSTHGGRQKRQWQPQRPAGKSIPIDGVFEVFLATSFSFLLFFQVLKKKFYFCFSKYSRFFPDVPFLNSFPHGALAFWGTWHRQRAKLSEGDAN